MHANIYELIFVKLEGVLAELLVQVYPKKYGPNISSKNGKKVLYIELKKSLYGTLQAALLFWENLSGYLVNNLRFKINSYDQCVANKIINGKQCTIVWHIDNLKLSHVDVEVVEDIVAHLNKKIWERGTHHSQLWKHT